MMQLDMSALAQGVYLLKISWGQKEAIHPEDYQLTMNKNENEKGNYNSKHSVRRSSIR